MDPFTAMMLGGAAVQVGSGLLGYFLSKGDRETADRLQREALARYGEVTDEAINAVATELIPPSEMAQIQLDPAYKDAQMAALDSLQGISDSGGLTISDEAALNKLDNRLGRQENVERQRISDEMSSRGIGGSGTELAMLRASGQDRLQRQSEANQESAGRAQQRAFDAIMAGGQLAGNIRGQDFSEQSQKAQAQDAISRYNAGAINQGRQWKAGAQMDRAGNMLQGQNGIANSLRGNAQDLRQTVAGVGQGVGQGLQYGAVYGPQGTGNRQLAVPGSVQEQKAMGQGPQVAQANGLRTNKLQAEDYNVFDDEDLTRVS